MIIASSTVCGAVTYKQDLAKFDQEISVLKATMNTLDQKIALQNSTYIEKIEKLKKAEETINKIQHEVLQNKEEIKAAFIGLQKKIQYHALAIDSENDIELEDIVKRRMILGNLGDDATELKNLLDQNKVYEDQLASLKKDAQDLTDGQNILYGLLQDLESKKTKVASNYYENLQNKQKVEAEFFKTKVETSMAKDLKNLDLVQFLKPLDNYSRYDTSNGGVNFYVKGTQDIHALGDGRVVFVGDLASYGNVIMLDHGQDIRSVILGNFTSQVHKGDEVTKGQNIAVLSSAAEKENKIYVEIRKREVAQNATDYLVLN